MLCPRSLIYFLWMMSYCLVVATTMNGPRFHEIFSIFCQASGMETSCNKSSFISPGGSIDDQILALLPYPQLAMEEGFNYSGFLLKPNGYNKLDWNWLVEKVERKIDHWCYKWLSLGGRLTLAKVVWSLLHWAHHHSKYSYNKA